MANHGPQKPKPSQARIAATVEAISAATGVPAGEIRSSSRDGKATEARWLAWRELCEREGFGLSPTARAWGCHHASIIHARDSKWLSPYGRPPLTLPAERQSTYAEQRKQWAESVGRPYPERLA